MLVHFILLSYTRVSLNVGLIFVAESVAQDMVKNALHSLSDMRVAEYYNIANEKMASLTDAYHQEAALHELISRIDSYKSH